MNSTLRSLLAGRVLGLAGLTVAAATLMAPVPVVASTVTHTTPEHVLVNSDFIFQGTVIGTSVRWSNERNVFATTDYQIRIDRVVHDPQGLLAAHTQDGVTTLSFAGGTIDGTTYAVPGVPTLGVNEQAFFCVNAADMASVSPIVGLFHGLYRIAGVNGEWKVMNEGGCCGRPGPVGFRFFAKLGVAGLTYSPDEFATELARALPLAARSQDLRFGVNQAQPMANQAQCEINGSAGGTESGPVPAMVNPPSAKRRPEHEVIVEPNVERIAARQELEYGFFSSLPFGSAWNVTTAMGGPFRDAFIGQLSYWNFYAPDGFALYSNQNNTIGWPNSRNEAAFLTSAQTQNLYGYTWGANTLGICFSRSFLGQLLETDICFNPAFAFSTNAIDTYNDSNIFWFNQVALHEVGHGFGRLHSWDSDPAFIYPSTMNYFTNGFYQAEAGRVFADDAHSFRAAFPGNPSARTDLAIYLWSMAGAQSNGATRFNLTRDLDLAPSVVQGSSFYFGNAWLENVGTVTRTSNIQFWLDTNPHDGNLADAYYCSTSPVGYLAGGDGVYIGTYVTVPTSVPPGNYYLCAVIQEDDDFGTNDLAWSQTTVRVDALPPPGPPPNNGRGFAQSIGTGTFYGSTQFATNDGTANCGNSNSSPDVWFRFYSANSGRLEIDTCGSAFDTVVSVQERRFSFPGGILYVEVGCNDDAGGNGSCPGTYQSFVSVPVGGGDTYRIRLAGYNGARGNYALTTRFYPENDACSGATPVTAGTYYGNLDEATNDGTGSCGITETTPDLWYRFTAACSGDVAINTVGSSFDTVLEVWNGCPGGGGPVLCNDDCVGLLSCLTFTAIQGTDYLIRVSVFGDDHNPIDPHNVVLNISSPAPFNDICERPLYVSDIVFDFDTSCTSSDALGMPTACSGNEGGGCVNDFWVSYTAPITGQFQVTMCAGFPGSIAVYPGLFCPADAESAIACSINAAVSCTEPSIDIPVNAGDILLVRVGGAVVPGQVGTPAGAGTLTLVTIAPPPPACPQDYNQDGATNADDLADFITDYFADPAPARADYNGDGAVNADDIGDFITAYFGPGC